MNGFHSEPDSHWFQELYIPFEIANQGLARIAERFSDWSRAPQTWEGYHPNHDDYQIQVIAEEKFTLVLTLVRELFNR